MQVNNLFRVNSFIIYYLLFIIYYLLFIIILLLLLPNSKVSTLLFVNYFTHKLHTHYPYQMKSVSLSSNRAQAKL